MISNKGAMEELALPLFLTSLPLTIMGVLLPMYTSALGLKPLQITGLFSVFSLGFVIIRLLIGYITDKIGRKPIFIFGLLFYIAAYYIYSIARSISFIYLARSLQSIAAALVGISSYSIIADMNTKTNAHNFGKISSYSDKGGLLGIILCFYILNTPKLVDGWSRLFSVCAFAAIAAIIYSLIFIKNTKTKKEIGSIIGPILGGFAFQTINNNVPFFVSSIGFLMLLILSLKWFPIVVMEKEQ